MGGGDFNNLASDVSKSGHRVPPIATRPPPKAPAGSSPSRVDDGAREVVKLNPVIKNFSVPSGSCCS